MSTVFAPIPRVLHNLRIVPKWGGWCMLIGNPRAPRGCGLPQFCERLGLRRMDIIWMENEQITSRMLNYKVRHGRHKVPWYSELEARIADIDDDIDIDEANLPSRDAIIEQLEMNVPFLADGGDLQTTILDARLGKNETVRFYNGELSVVPEERLDLYMEEGLFTPTPLHITGSDAVPPIMEESLRDIVGALQLDGMSESQAMAEALSWGTVTDEDADTLVEVMRTRVPNYYLAIKDEYYYVFND